MEENKKSASPKKKPLRGKKVGFAEKKLRLTQTMAHRVYQGWHALPMDSCHDRPSDSGFAPRGDSINSINS